MIGPKEEGDVCVWEKRQKSQENINSELHSGCREILILEEKEECENRDFLDIKEYVYPKLKRQIEIFLHIISLFLLELKTTLLFPHLQV